MYYAEMENLYKILGVTNDAEDVVIKAAYRALAQRYHPDKFDGPKAEAERKMRDINYAYSILSDPGKRMVFDEQMASSNRDTPVDSQDSSYQGANDIGSSPTNVTPTKVHPWRRYFAKLIDWWILWGTLTGVVVYFLHPDITTGNAFFAKVLLLFFVIGIVGEACLLWGLGSTLGKWLFGIRVLDGGGRHLEFSTALKRSFLCLAQGCAMNIPLASTIANVFAYQRLKETGSTRWDDSTGAVVVCEKTGLLRISFAVISVVAVVIVSSILTMSERGNHIPVKTVEPVVDRQQQDLLQAAQEIMAKFPQLDVESADKDQVAIDFVVRIRDGYIAKGYAVDIALRMAANDYAEELQRLAQQRYVPQIMTSSNQVPSAQVKSASTWNEKNARGRKCIILPVMSDAEIAACR